MPLKEVSCSAFIIQGITIHYLFIQGIPIYLLFVQGIANYSLKVQLFIIHLYKVKCLFFNGDIISMLSYIFIRVSLLQPLL